MILGQYNLFKVRACNHTYNWLDGDTEELYKKNLTLQPANWFYRNNPITYKYNSNGFRCVEIDALNFDNYILFLGDSHSEGIGLHLEHTYPYQVSKKLYKSYYNLSIGGTGLDIMLYNLMSWLHTFPHPKYIVLFYTENTRSLLKGIGDFEYANIGVKWTQSKTGNNEDIKKFLVLGDLIGFFHSRIHLYVNIIDSVLKFHKIPYKNITSYDHKLDNPQNIEVIDSFNKPRARDYHVGVEWHNEVTELLVNDFLDKYSNA